VSLYKRHYHFIVTQENYGLYGLHCEKIKNYDYPVFWENFKIGMAITTKRSLLIMTLPFMLCVKYNYIKRNKIYLFNFIRMILLG